MADHSDDAQGRPTPDSWQRSVGPVIVLILLVGSATASLLAPVLGMKADARADRCEETTR